MTSSPRALIAEDEPLLAEDLRQALARAWPELQIAAMVGDGLSAARQALALQPDVLFFDIRMPGQSGLEAAAELADAWPEAQPFPILVFVTAYDQYAMDAFEAQAVDYLLKPVRAQRLLAALLRARTLIPSEHLDAIDALAKATNTRRRHLSVHERGRVILVALEQVIYLKAELKYITVRTREREYLIEESLTSLEEEFSDRFVRIHRNALVARPSIAGFERVSPSGEGESGDPYWQVVLREVPDRLPVSRRQWSIVKGLVS